MTDEELQREAEELSARCVKLTVGNMNMEGLYLTEECKAKMFEYGVQEFLTTNRHLLDRHIADKQRRRQSRET